MGIVYAIGQTNCVFDKSQPYYMSASEIGEAFGVAASTAGNRGKQVRDLLKIRFLDQRWMRVEFVESSGVIWWVSINGLIVGRRAQHAVRDPGRGVSARVYPLYPGGSKLGRKKRPKGGRPLGRWQGLGACAIP